MKSFFLARLVTCSAVTRAWWFAVGRHWQPAPVPGSNCGCQPGHAIYRKSGRSGDSPGSSLPGVGDLTHFMYA